MLMSDQIRAARALLRWSAQDLAGKAGIGISTVQRMENAEGVPSASGKNLEAVQRALERAGVEFITENGGGPGVRLKKRGKR
jgi:transcriptional regulator with XRE-family HTH domain